KDRAKRKAIQEAAVIIAAWGPDIFDYYGLASHPDTTIAMIAGVTNRTRLELRAAWYTAIKLIMSVDVPKWSEAKLLLNAMMMIRHCERVVDGENSVPSIGERPSSMKNVTPTSPFLRRDFQALSGYLSAPETPSDEQAKLAALAVLPRGIPVSEFELDHDKFGILQPMWQSFHGLPRGSKRVHDCVQENNVSIEDDVDWLSRKRTQLPVVVYDRARKRKTKIGQAIVEHEAWEDECPDARRNGKFYSERGSTRRSTQAASPEHREPSSPRVDQQSGEQSHQVSATSSSPPPSSRASVEPASLPDPDDELVAEAGSEPGSDTDSDKIQMSTGEMMPGLVGSRFEEIEGDEREENSPARGLSMVLITTTRAHRTERDHVPFFAKFEPLRAAHVKALAGARSRELQIQCGYLEQLPWATLHIDPSLSAAADSRPSGLVDEAVSDIVILSSSTFQERARQRDESGRYLWVPSTPYHHSPTVLGFLRGRCFLPL
ncbi:hypothetical protein LTR95_019084, partial [Oleoguttula sp. CCFEE 5521]